MKTKQELQPGTEIGAATTQLPEFAKNVGNAKSGIAVINVTNVATAGVYTFAIDHASSPAQNSGSTRSNWVQLGTASTGSLPAGGAQSVTIALTNVMELVRWRCTACPGVCTFSITLFLWDT